jgi:hypothetical protein
MMIGRLDRDVLAVVAKIEDDQVVVGQEMPPIGVIGIGGKAISVREQDPRARGIAMAPDPDLGAVVKTDLEDSAGSGKLKRHRRLRRIRLELEAIGSDLRRRAVLVALPRFAADASITFGGAKKFCQVRRRVGKRLRRPIQNKISSKMGHLENSDGVRPREWVN